MVGRNRNKRPAKIPKPLGKGVLVTHVTTTAIVTFLDVLFSVRRRAAALAIATPGLKTYVLSMQGHAGNCKLRLGRGAPSRCRKFLYSGLAFRFIGLFRLPLTSPCCRSSARGSGTARKAAWFGLAMFGKQAGEE